MLIALDLGSVTGVCAGEPGARPSCVSWRLPKGGGAEVGAFAAAFEGYLLAALDNWRPELIAFEAPFLGPKLAGNMDVARRLLGLPMLVELIAHKAGIECVEIGIGTARKALVGVGRAEKSAVITAARRRGFSVQDDHQADACAVWLCAVGMRWPRLIGHYDPLFLDAR
jgi:Holliday junction resolvasome RuvABC endonuclease subunit